MTITTTTWLWIGGFCVIAATSVLLWQRRATIAQRYAGWREAQIRQTPIPVTGSGRVRVKYVSPGRYGYARLVPIDAAGNVCGKEMLLNLDRAKQCGIDDLEVGQILFAQWGESTDVSRHMDVAVFISREVNLAA